MRTRKQVYEKKYESQRLGQKKANLGVYEMPTRQQTIMSDATANQAARQAYPVSDTSSA